MKMDESGWKIWLKVDKLAWTTYNRMTVDGWECMLLKVYESKWKWMKMDESEF